MTTTGTREPNTGETPIPSWVNRGENETPDETIDYPKTPNKAFAIMVVVALIVIAVIAGVFIATRGDDGAADREVTRSKAEAVLRARFNDTSASVGPLQTIKVEWVGDQLVATWTQGEAAQKRCTAPVLISANGQNFGIAAFEPVPFDKQSAAPANCVVTAGLEYGFPLEE